MSDGTGNITRSIVDYIVSMSFGHVPGNALEAAKRCIADCVGVSLAAAAEDVVKIAVEYVKNTGAPEASVIGAVIKTSAEQAAWVNGIEGHALDYDDYFTLDGSTPYHPTVAILPAIMASAEVRHASGRDMLLSYLVGFEVQARLASLCAESQYETGWHTTSTMGAIGAAAGVAKLLELSPDQVRASLGIAATFASGLRKNFGTMCKPLHAGNAAKNGLAAARLAQAGFSADMSVLDGPIGFCSVLSGGKLDRFELVAAQKDFYILNPGVSLKPYPSCAYTHPAIDTALELRAELDLEDVDEIEYRTSSGVPRILMHSWPSTGLEAKFSMEYCVAIALSEGNAGLQQFSDAKANETSIQDLMRKIRYVHPPEMGSSLAGMAGQLVVRLKDGRIRSAQVDAARGTPRNPLSVGELSAKFTDCAGRSLSAEGTKKTLHALMNLEHAADVCELVRGLAPG